MRRKKRLFDSSPRLLEASRTIITIGVSSPFGFGDSSIMVIELDWNFSSCGFTKSCFSVSCFSCSCVSFCLQFTGLKMCIWREIDFLVKHFTIWFDGVALAETYCWQFIAYVTDIDDCASNPCEDRGTASCHDLTAAFRCECKEGFTGSRCETGKGYDVFVFILKLKLIWCKFFCFIEG